MPLHPRTCSGLYSVSCLLDALDGYAARHFEQSTRFGAVLDMVTDRCTTSCLLVFLSSAWPRWAIVFQGLISLDLASHYVHMYATLIMGGAETSHKKVDKSRSFILNLYYTNKVRGPLSYFWQGSVLTACLDGPVPFLRSQRTLLHCHVPSVILVAVPVPVSTSSDKQRYLINASTREPCHTPHASLLRQSLQRRCIGICASKQDGLVLAMGHCWSEFPNYGWKANHQCSSIGQGQ
jgi:phosphatidylglycerophosphate synthase